MEQEKNDRGMRYLICPICKSAWFAVAPGSRLLQHCHKCKREFWVTAEEDTIEIRIVTKNK